MNRTMATRDATTAISHMAKLVGVVCGYTGRQKYRTVLLEITQAMELEDAEFEKMIMEYGEKIDSLDSDGEGA